MNFRFHPEAEVEFNNAIDYYEETQEHLGWNLPKRFMQQFNESLTFHWHGTP